jgi:hypothetical protein
VCQRHGKKREEEKCILVGKPEVKRSLGTSRRNVKIRGRGCEGEGWIDPYEHSNVLSGSKNAGNFFNSSEIITASRKDLLCRVGLN